MSVGCLPKSCCTGEGVQYTHCIQQVHLLLHQVQNAAEHREIKHSIPGNPPSLGALHGTLHNTVRSLPPSLLGAPTHTVHTQNLLAHVHSGLLYARSTFVKSCFSPGLLFPSSPCFQLTAVNPGPNPLAVVYLVFCPSGEVSTETEAQ